MKSSAFLPLLAAFLFLGGCGNERSASQFSDAYLAALEQRPGTIVQDAWLEDFTDAYGDFTGTQLSQRLRDTYAAQFYFNDTLRSLRERPALVAYLQETAQRLESMELTILGRYHSGADAYVRWSMRTRFRAGWRTVDTTTLGMTHLRFNEQGKVILHQDFWDSRQGIFEHLPVVGGMINWVRKRL